MNHAHRLCSSPFLLLLLGCLAEVSASIKSLSNEVTQVSTAWHGTTVDALFNEYYNIFRHGNRNAASHLWVQFLLERSEQMMHDQMVHLFSGFCAVSGSPVRPSDFNRYKLRLDKVDGSGRISGFMHYCCWPCVCDTQDFIRVDTRNVTTKDGTRRYHFAVIGNPCDRPEELTLPFQDAFGRGMSSLARDAPEVRCSSSGELIGAPLSDHGFVIIAMFFDYPTDGAADATNLVSDSSRMSQPGRVSEDHGVKFQDEIEYRGMCEDRKSNGYNSGMGEIFRKVAAISPVTILPAIPAPEAAAENSSEVCQERISAEGHSETVCSTSF